jgi:hypothetical protein
MRKCSEKMRPKPSVLNRKTNAKPGGAAKKKRKKTFSTPKLSRGSIN